MDNRYNRHNRRKYSLKVHIVLVTKYRKKLLKGSITDDVKQKIFDIANTRGYEIIAMEADKDHLHFLISYDTTDRVCDIVKIVKQETTYYLWQKYGSFLSKHCLLYTSFTDMSIGLCCLNAQILIVFRSIQRMDLCIFISIGSFRDGICPVC